MSQPILRHSTKVYTRKLTCLTHSRSFTSRTSNWFTRFLSPSEEKKLYLGITSAFREKLVEQANKSAKNYSHIIEHAILSSKPDLPSKTSKIGMLSLARLEQLKLDLDAAGKAKDIQQLKKLEEEMDQSHLQTVTIYNRLIRAYLWSNSLELAVQVLNGLEERGLVPTTRSFTYLIQVYLKRNQLDQAKELVERMQDLSLLRLRNSFDCSIMLKFYEACGDSHAIEFLWRDVLIHRETIQPGASLWTQYLEHLLLSQTNDVKAIQQLSKDYLLHFGHNTLNTHQYASWIKAVEHLAQSDRKEAVQTSEQLLFQLIKIAPQKTSREKTKHAIQYIIRSYLSRDQDLKAITFYYNLRKAGVPDQAFDQEIIHSIETAVKDVEERSSQSSTSESMKAMMTELEELLLTKA